MKTAHRKQAKAKRKWQAAIQHGLALEAANMQAIERAKERMK